MKKPHVLAALAAFVLVLVATACQPSGPVTITFEMTDAEVVMDWVVVRDQELACSAPEFAGGEISGQGTFGALGQLDIGMSAAWNVGNANPDPADAVYEPQSTYAAGPFAPVLAQADYPYSFASNPFTSACEPTVSATGVLELTATSGDRIEGLVVGGETHRLDVNAEGDGVEVFAEIEFNGGTGEFADASGSAVLHVITHFDPGTMQFVVDEVGTLSGGTIQY